MPNALRNPITIVVCSLVLLLTINRCYAQQLNCGSEVAFKGAKQLSILTLFKSFSEEQKVSILAEIRYDDSTRIDVEPGDYSLEGLAKRFDDALRCEVVNGTLHVFDDRVVTLKGDVLGYKFSTFKMPPNVDRFRIVLTERLTKEAFSAPTSEKTLVQQLGGGLAFNAEQFPLQDEVFRDVEARKLIYTVAGQHILSSVICFPGPEKGFTDRDTWKFAASHWFWDVSH